MFKNKMTNKKEVLELKNGEPEEKEKNKRDETPNLQPGKEIVKNRENFLKTREEIKEKETQVRFFENLGQAKTEYSKAPFEIGNNRFTVTFENIEADGRPVKENEYGKLKREVEGGDKRMDQVEGIFTVESKDGIKISQRIPASVMANGVEVMGFIENAFSGGAEKSKKDRELVEAQRERLKNIETRAPGKEESDTEKAEKTRLQVEAVKGKAEKMKGRVSVLEGKNGITVNINFSDRQLSLKTNGAIWSATEGRDNGQTINNAGSSPDPLDLLVEQGEKKSE